MLARILGAAALVTALPGCAPQSSHPTETAQWRECDREAFAQASGRVARFGSAGPDGRVVVKLVEDDGPCGGGLVVLTDAGVRGEDVSDLGLRRETAELVRLADGQRLLRIDGAGHPRGGYQPHLFALAPRVAELRVDRAPLLPFVATDGGAAPTAARCGEDGTLEVLRATTSEPPGVVLAWDVYRTTYEIDGPRVEKLATEQIRDHIADPLLHQQMPEMFGPGALLHDCA